MLQPTNPSSFAWVSLICSRRGGSTAAVLALDTAVEESRKKMADRVARSPVRLCSRDGKICYYRRLEYDFLFLNLASYFLFLSFFLSVRVRVCFSSSCYFVRAAVICSTLASTCVLLVICIPPYLIIPFASFVLHFFVFLVILGRRVCCALVSDTLAFDLPTLS